MLVVTVTAKSKTVRVKPEWEILNQQGLERLQHDPFGSTAETLEQLQG